jgi:hypothetical protein
LLLALSGLLSSLLLSGGPPSLLAVGLGLLCDITLWWVLPGSLLAPLVLALLSLLTLLAGVGLASPVLLSGLLPTLVALKTGLGLAPVTRALLGLAPVGLVLWLSRWWLTWLLLTPLALVLWLAVGRLRALTPVLIRLLRTV